MGLNTSLLNHNIICGYESKTLSYFADQLFTLEKLNAELHISDCDFCCDILAHLVYLSSKEESEAEILFLNKNLTLTLSKIRADINSAL